FKSMEGDPFVAQFSFELARTALRIILGLLSQHFAGLFGHLLNFASLEQSGMDRHADRLRYGKNLKITMSRPGRIGNHVKDSLRIGRTVNCYQEPRLDSWVQALIGSLCN